MPNPELTPKQQWSELVKNSQSILVVTHKDPDGDAIGSALAVKLGLEKLGKQVTVVAEGETGKSFSFLPQIKSLSQTINLQKDLLVLLDESQAKIGNVSLKRVSENKLIVVITPKEGLLTSANVKIEEGSYKVDLIIVLDSSDLNRLGSIYEQNHDLFYEVPVVNIDHHPGNANFGKVNIVDLTASSTAEILVSLLETIGKEVPNLIDAEIATCLLTGLTTDTGSFQNANTTPKSLTVAAQMVAAGARQQDIIRNIYKTRSLSTLRLWGRALSYIKEEPNFRFAWSVLSKADFVAAQAQVEESSGVIDELLKTAAGMEFVLLLSERETGIHGSFRSVDQSRDVSKLANLFNGGGHPQAAAFIIPGATLREKEPEIITKLREHLGGAKTSKIEGSEQPQARPQQPSTPGSTEPSRKLTPPPIRPARPQPPQAPQPESKPTPPNRPQASEQLSDQDLSDGLV